MNPLEIFFDSLDQPLRIGSFVLAFSWTTIILQFVLPLLLLFLVSYFLFRWLKSYLGKTTLSGERKQKVIGGVRFGLRLFFVLIVIVLSGRFLEDRFMRFVDDIFKAIRSPFYKSGATEISILTLILAIPVFYLATLAGKAAKVTFERSKIFTNNLAESRRYSIANLIRYIVLVIALVVGLSVIGVDLSAIAIILVVLGVGIGIGLQQVVASFFAGLVIVLNRPLKEGDFIQVSVNGIEHEGMVKQIRMLNSIITTSQNETIIMPNSHLLHNAVHNLSYLDAQYEVCIDICLQYGEDIEKAQASLVAIAKRCSYWNGTGEPNAPIREFSPLGVKLQLRLQLASAIDRDAAIAAINQDIYRDFRSQKISFASERHGK